MSAFVVVVDLASSIDRHDVESVLELLRPTSDGHEVIERGPCVIARSCFRSTPEAHLRELDSFDGQASVLVFDGRLDNREELSAELGCPLGISDPQLVLKAYERWGDCCVSRLAGDFALAVWLPTEHRLFAACDVMGGRHLRYCLVGSRLVLGSRTAVVAALSPGAWRPNLRLLAAHVKGNFAPWISETCYAGVRRLWAGSAFSFSPAGLRSWTHGSARTWPDLDGEPVRGVRAAVVNSVRTRMRSRTPVATSLSGGLDSAFVTGVAGACGAVTAYSSVFATTPRADERDNAARLVAAWPSITWETLTADDDVYFDLSRDCSHHQWDEVEYGYPSGMLHRRLSAAVATGHRVMLTGHYADQLLTSGYSSWAHLTDFPVRQWSSEWPHFARYGGAGPAAVSVGLFRGLGRRLRGSSSLIASSRRAILGPWSVWNRGFLTAAADNAGIELRFPFLDADLARRVWNLPPAYWCQRGWSKYGLRMASEGFVPPGVAWESTPAVFGDLVLRGLDRNRDRLRRLLQHSLAVQASIVHAGELWGLLERPIVPPVRGRLRPLMRWLEVEMFFRALQCRKDVARASRML